MVGRGSGGDVPVFPRGFVTIVIVVAVVWSDEYPIERGHERYGARDREFTDVDREFSYKLVLTQIRSNHRVATGEVDMTVEGKHGSKLISLPLQEMPGHENEHISFNFKYFQNVDGIFLLPTGFKPVKVKLSVKPSGKRLKGIERAYRWKDVLAGGV